jgi:hypothetical protein
MIHAARMFAQRRDCRTIGVSICGIAVENYKKVRVIGALVRPSSPEFEPHLGRDFDWIKPITGKSQLTMTHAEYAALFEKGGV